jgi:ABC-type glycerol-3-phosphate transport system substrate-binding protein
MNVFKKSFAMVLALLMLLSAVSCSESTENSAGDAAAETTVSAEAVSAEEAPVEEDDGKTHYADEIAAVDYDGWTLRIANDGLSAEYFSGFTMEELTGDAFNDAIYDRNVRVSEKFNVTIEENNGGSVNLIKNAVTAGTGDVGFGYVLFYNCMGLISQNYVKAVSDMPVFDFSKPYWDRGSQETLTIGGKLFYGHCDISFDHYEGMALLFYNGDLLEANSISETPYELYTSGKWTLDAMLNMMTTVARDENGDGVMDAAHDTFGWSGREFEYLPSLYSSNLRLVKYDSAENTYKMNLVDDGVMAVGDMLNKIINDKSLSLPGRNDETRNLFKEGGVLFYSRLMGDFRNLRDKEDDYGIICYPALEENTDGMVYVQNPFTVMIPSDCDDDERLATLIEALAADTYDNVLDIYIEKAVIGKGARDIESANLLRDFIQKRAYDMSYAFDVFDAIKAYNNAIPGGNYASAASRTEKPFNKNIQKALEALGMEG